MARPGMASPWMTVTGRSPPAHEEICSTKSGGVPDADLNSATPTVPTGSRTMESQPTKQPHDREDNKNGSKRAMQAEAHAAEK